MSRVLEFKQSPSADPDYEVAGIIEWSEGLRGALLLVREIGPHVDERSAGDESGEADGEAPE